MGGCKWDITLPAPDLTWEASDDETHLDTPSPKVVYAAQMSVVRACQSDMRAVAIAENRRTRRDAAYAVRALAIIRDSFELKRKSCRRIHDAQALSSWLETYWSVDARDQTHLQHMLLW